MQHMTAAHPPHLFLLQHPQSSTTSVVPAIPRNIFPLRFLFVTRDDHFSLHPNTILSYEEFGRRSCSMSNDGNGPSHSDNCLGQYPASGVIIEEIDESAYDTLQSNICSVRVDYSNTDMDPIQKVVDTYGLLEHIFTFCLANDILSASIVSVRWKQAGRNDGVWKQACMDLWRDKIGMPVVRRGNSLALFWRSMLSSEVVNRLSVKEIRAIFSERPLGRRDVRDAFTTFLEKSEMRNAVLEFMPQHLGGVDYGMERDRILSQGFEDMWFGSFASSLIDSRRTTLTLDELCSQNGFDMHFKIMYEEDEDLHGQHQNTSDSRGGIKLHFHSTCYFDENNEFRMDTSGEADMHHPIDLTWQWTVPGKVVQVGPYPPLIVSRLENWGWRLENHHVVLYSHV